MILFPNRIEGCWEALFSVLDGFAEAAKISAVYGVGYLGFWLYDHLVAYGIDARVLPFSLIPQA